MTLHQAPPPDSAPLLSDYVDKFQLARELGRGSRTVDRLVLGITYLTPLKTERTK